jgi:hypothetical protein
MRARDTGQESQLVIAAAATPSSDLSSPGIWIKLILDSNEKSNLFRRVAPKPKWVETRP